MTNSTAMVRDPAWHAHRFDPTGDAFHYIPADRAARTRATFLTDAELGEAAKHVTPIAREAAVVAADRPVAPLRYVFHSAFCCSTLVARALDLPGVATALKEPVILNDLIGWRRRGGAPRDVAERLDHALAVLAAPVASGEALLIKPSNVVNALAPAMLALRPDSRALLLHAPLPTFLASVASKGLEGRLWVRELWIKLAADGLCGMDLSPADPLRHTDLQIAGLGWLAQHRLFSQVAQRFAGRVRTLDSAALLADPEASMSALADLFGLAIDAAMIASGPAFTRHSKTGEGFGNRARAAVHDSARAAHGEEIAMVEQWIVKVAEANDIALTLPCPLF